jgi:hypothetical protein
MATSKIHQICRQSLAEVVQAQEVAGARNTHPRPRAKAPRRTLSQSPRPVCGKIVNVDRRTAVHVFCIGLGFIYSPSQYRLGH